MVSNAESRHITGLTSEDHQKQMFGARVSRPRRLPRPKVSRPRRHGRSAGESPNNFVDSVVVALIFVVVRPVRSLHHEAGAKQ